MCFIQIDDQLFFFNHQSPSSLNVWKMVVKFLGVTAIFLVIQSWKDAAAGQLVMRIWGVGAYVVATEGIV